MWASRWKIGAGGRQHGNAPLLSSPGAAWVILEVRAVASAGQTGSLRPISSARAWRSWQPPAGCHPASPAPPRDEVLMLIVHVFVHVKPEFIEAFQHATIENAANSVQEPGIARFDVIQQADDPTRFTLVEVYRDADSPGPAQGDRALPGLGRAGGGHDGRAAHARRLRQHLPRRPGLVSGHEIRVRHRCAHPVRRGRLAQEGAAAAAMGRRALVVTGASPERAARSSGNWKPRP